MTENKLGDLEFLVLLATLRLGDDAYAVTIQDEIRERAGRSVTRATVYVTLKRLEEKGLMSSWLGDPLPERGGKARRHVRVEPAGLDAVRDTRLGLERMWQGLTPIEGA